MKNKVFVDFISSHSWLVIKTYLYVLQGVQRTTLGCGWKLTSGNRKVGKDINPWQMAK